MLPLFRRAAAGRAISAVAVSSTSKIIPFIASSSSRRVRRLAPIVRSFSASAWIRFPDAVAATPSKAAAKSPTAKKSGTKTTAKKKTKKPAAKKKPAVKKRKVLTPEQKEKKELSQLRKMALPKAPKGKPANAWTVFLADNVGSGSGTALRDKVKDISAQFKSLSEFEKTRLHERAQSNVATNKVAFKQWVESYPVEAIFMANLARRRLARKLEKKRPSLLHDDRLPKPAPSAYSLYIKSHHDEVSAASPTDTFRQLAAQWKAMSESEKHQLKEAASADVKRVKEATEELRAKGKAYWAERGL